MRRAAPVASAAIPTAAQRRISVTQKLGSLNHANFPPRSVQASNSTAENYF
jgi:hypothetical protein